MGKAIWQWLVLVSVWVKAFWYWAALVGILAAAAGAQEHVERGISIIKTPDGASGTCFAVKRLEGAVLFATAAHVTQYQNSATQIYSGETYTISTGDGIINAACIATDAQADIAVLRAKTTLEFKILEIADPGELVGEAGPDYVPPRVPCRWLGYAGARDTITETIGFVSLINRNSVYSDGVLLPGQSGGPMLGPTGKVIGVNSGGSFWLGSESTQGTWPARAGSGKRLKEIVEGIKK